MNLDESGLFGAKPCQTNKGWKGHREATTSSRACVLAQGKSEIARVAVVVTIKSKSKNDLNQSFSSQNGRTFPSKHQDNHNPSKSMDCTLRREAAAQSQYSQSYFPNKSRFFRNWLLFSMTGIYHHPKKNQPKNINKWQENWNWVKPLIPGLIHKPLDGWVWFTCPY